MTNSHLDYSKWVEEALREVVRHALEDAVDGMPGEHHFYISFRTDAPGVEIPDYLHIQYPHEMTIVLQHQYWDLRVFPLHFEATLSFNRVNATLRIPFAALTTFNDPSVNFGLQLQMTGSDAARTDGANADRPATAATEPAKKPKPSLPVAALEARETSPEAPPDDPASPAPKDESTDAGQKEGQIIALDAFRNK
jgi:hypothetical protein